MVRSIHSLPCCLHNQPIWLTNYLDTFSYKCPFSLQTTLYPKPKPIPATCKGCNEIGKRYSREYGEHILYESTVLTSDYFGEKARDFLLHCLFSYARFARSSKKSFNRVICCAGHVFRHVVQAEVLARLVIPSSAPQSGPEGGVKKVGIAIKVSVERKMGLRRWKKA